MKHREPLHVQSPIFFLLSYPMAGWHPRNFQERFKSGKRNPKEERTIGKGQGGAVMFRRAKVAGPCTWGIGRFPEDISPPNLSLVTHTSQTQVPKHFQLQFLFVVPYLQAKADLERKAWLLLSHTRCVSRLGVPGGFGVSPSCWCGGPIMNHW